jgi:hypothetical protein
VNQRHAQVGVAHIQTITSGHPLSDSRRIVGNPVFAFVGLCHHAPGDFRLGRHFDGEEDGFGLARNPTKFGGWCAIDAATKSSSNCEFSKVRLPFCKVVY